MRPLVPPGEYKATLKANGEELSTDITVRADPRLDVEGEDYEKQAEKMLDLQDLLSETNKLINESNKVLKQLKDLKKSLKENDEAENKETIIASIDKVQKELEDLQDEWRRPPPNMTYRQKPRLREEIRSLMRAIDNAPAKPTAPQVNRVDQLEEETAEAQKKYEEGILQEIATLNKLLKEFPRVITRISKP